MSAAAFRAARELHERVYEQRERRRLFDRLAGVIPFCAGCGRLQDPGQTFEDRLDGLFCPSCLDAEMENGFAQESCE